MMIRTLLRRLLGAIRAGGLWAARAAVIGVLCLPLATDGLGQAGGPGEYRVKAVFLHHFTKYVEWPARVFERNDSPLVIGVLGHADQIRAPLEEAVNGRHAGGRPLSVRYFAPGEDYTKCHILFISDSERQRIPVILRALDGRPVLSVGESEDFAALGGVVNFVIDDNRVRFQINVDAARASELKLQATLLNLAIIVRARR